MTVLQTLYSVRTKYFINKALPVWLGLKSFYNKFSLTANILLLLLLFSPSVFSLVTRFPAKANAGNSPVSASIAYKPVLHSPLQAPAVEQYQAMPYSSIKNKSKTLPRKIISIPFKIRRTRGLVSKTNFHVVDGVVSNITFINNGLRFPDTGNPPWQFYKRPPGTIFKLRI